MISRGTSMAIVAAYVAKFTSRTSRGPHRTMVENVHCDLLYDFLYQNDYEAWFCNAARKPASIRRLKDWLLKIHTGESLALAAPEWPWEKRRALGQQYLRSLARDFLVWYSDIEPEAWRAEEYAVLATELHRRVEMDGFVFRDGDLVQVEMDILDVDEEKGLLERLYRSAGLERSQDAMAFLRFSERHFVEGNWADCIANSRKFLELSLLEGAMAVAHARGNEISEQMMTRPVEIRSFLEREKLIEKKEREVLDKLYGLLSHTGSHPYMAEKDQARLLRQLSMTISQFILLRLESALKSNS